MRQVSIYLFIFFIYLSLSLFFFLSLAISFTKLNRGKRWLHAVRDEDGILIDSVIEMKLIEIQIECANRNQNIEHRQF